jgi:hypothetical protein
MPLVSCSCPRHEAYRKNNDMAPLILNLGTRMSCVTSITPRSQSRYWWFWRSGLLPLPGLDHTVQPAAGRYTTPAVFMTYIKKSKGIPRQAEVALGVPGRLRPRIISTFGTTRVVGRQPYAPAAFTPREIRGTHFQRLSRPQGTWFCRKEPQKNPQWHHRESIPGPSD